MALAARPIVTFVTGNANKLAEVIAILGDDAPITLRAEKVDLPELQGTPEDVSRAKCKLAAKQVGGAVMVEDTSLCFRALNGLPGVYIKWFLDGIGHDGLNRMLAGFDDKSAYAQCIFAYAPSADAEPLLFVGQCDGKIVPARGPNNFGWDPIFEPIESGGKTFAEMEKAEKNKISHRYRSLDALRTYLHETSSAAADHK